MGHSLGDEATQFAGKGESLPDLIPGDVIERYRVIRLLGRGGMGQVYEVEHVELGTRHALKIIPSELAGQRGFIDRFRREATVMAQLQHPGIVHVRDFACTEGRYWLQMDLVKGVPVAQQRVAQASPMPGSSDKREQEADRDAFPFPLALRAQASEMPGPPIEGRAVSLADLAAASGGKLDQALLADLLCQVLEALAYAHGRGTVHRDLKPGNILLDEGSRVGPCPTPEGTVGPCLTSRSVGPSDGGTAGRVGPCPTPATPGNGVGGTGSHPTCSAPRGGTGAHLTVVVRISDFGLVRLVGEEWVRGQAARSVSTNMSTLGGAVTEAPEGSGESTRALLGTYEYMSPEQKEGAHVDHRSDLYAVGLMAARLLTGRRELGYDLPTDIDSSLHPAWNDFMKQAIAPDLDRRYQSAAEMGEAVKGIAEAVASGKSGPRLREKRRGGVFASIAVAVVVLLAIAGAFFAMERPGGNERSGGVSPPAKAAPALAPTPAPSVSPSAVAAKPEPKLPGTRPAVEPPSGQGGATAAQTPSRVHPRPSAVARSVVVPLRAKAEMAWERVKDLDRGDGFGKLLDEAAVVRRSAQTWFDEKDNAQAKRSYEDLLKRCEALRALEAKRDAARAVWKEAKAARQRADERGARDRARPLWEGGGNLSNLADKAFQAGRFDEAARAWAQTRKQYREAETHAIGVQRVEGAASGYAADLRKADAGKLDRSVRVAAFSRRERVGCEARSASRRSQARRMAGSRLSRAASLASG